MMTQPTIRPHTNTRLAALPKGLAIALGLAVIATQSPLLAQVTWDGNGAPDTGGNWDVGNNWDGGDAVPTSLSDVVLPSVTTGTRIISQNVSGGTTINKLTIQQSNEDGINKLSLASNISIGTNGPYTVSLSGGATVANVVLDLNGFTLIATRAGGASNFLPSFGGTINFNSAGSQIALDLGTANTTANLTGAVNVTADGSIARKSSDATNQTGNVSVNFTASSVVNISSGTLNLEYLGRKGDGDIFNVNTAVGSSTTIAAGAGLAVKYQASAASANNIDYVSRFTNAGQLSQSGSFSTQAARDGTPGTPRVPEIINSGTWTISGTAATVTRLTDFQNALHIGVPVFTNSGTGTLRGNSASDTLEFNEQVASSSKMTITNDGIIAPGAGTSGSLLASVGVLSLLDINLTVGATGTINMDIGGILPGEFDRLDLLTGLTDPTGAGTLDLSGNGTLALKSVNGFDFMSPFSPINLIQAGAVTGMFASITLDGNAFNTGTSHDFGDGRTLSVIYSPTGVDLVLIPEPSTLAMLGLTALALVFSGRRRR